MGKLRWRTWRQALRAYPLKTKLAMYAVVLGLTQGIMAAYGAALWARGVVLVVIAVVGGAQELDDLRTRNREKRDAEREKERQHADAETAWHRTMANNLRLWPTPSVEEVDPCDLGVRRSAKAERQRKNGDILAPYVGRDIDASADKRLKESGLVLMIGVPAAGITRTAYELAYRAAPTARVLAPLAPLGLRSALDNDVLSRLAPPIRLLLWLDRINRFADDGLSVAMLRECRKRSPGLRVVATIPSGEAYARWAADSADVAAEFGDPLVLERLPSRAELERAQAIYPDPQMDFTQGIAAAFTAAASLLKRFNAGNSACDYSGCRGDCALSRAVVNIAIEWTGTGSPRPLTTARLSALAQQRLSQPVPPDAAHLASTLRWAVSPVDEGASLVHVESEDGTEIVRANSEISEIRLAEDSSGPGEAVWLAAVDDAVVADDSEALGRVGFRAHVGGNLGIAERVWANVGDLDDPAVKWVADAARFSHNRADPEAQLVPERRLLELTEAKYGSNSRELADRLNDVGSVMLALRQPREALERLIRARTILESSGEADPALARVLSSVGVALALLGDLAAAVDVFDRALEINEREFGDESLQVANTLKNLGNAWKDLGKPEHARALLERTLRIKKREFGDESPEVAGVLSDLGNVWIALGDPRTARALYEEALEILQRDCGIEHARLTPALTGLGSAWRHLGQPDKARVQFERVMRIRMRQSGRLPPQDLSNLAGALSDLGELDRALELYEEALPILERQFGTEHPKVIPALVGLGTTWTRLGKPAKAMQYFDRALSISEKYFGPDHPHGVGILNNVAIAWMTAGKVERAKSVLAKGLNILHTRFPGGHPLVKDLAANMRLVDPDVVVLEDGRIVDRGRTAGGT